MNTAHPRQVYWHEAHGFGVAGSKPETLMGVVVAPHRINDTKETSWCETSFITANNREDAPGMQYLMKYIEGITPYKMN